MSVRCFRSLSMEVFLLGLGLGASVAMTSAACDKAGGCKVSDDDVSFMQLSLVQGKYNRQFNRQYNRQSIGKSIGNSIGNT